MSRIPRPGAFAKRERHARLATARAEAGKNREIPVRHDLSGIILAYYRCGRYRGRGQGFAVVSSVERLEPEAGGQAAGDRADSDLMQPLATVREASVTYRIFYPSGKTFELDGMYMMADVGAWRCPCIDSGEHVHVLDQRAIIMQDGAQIYHPRRNLDGLDPNLKKWLDENSEW